jgi:hypothetical protein
MNEPNISRRIVAALRDGPKSRSALIKDTFRFEINGKALDEAFDSLVKAGKAKRFWNWPFPGEQQQEFWTLPPSGPAK